MEKKIKRFIPELWQNPEMAVDNNNLPIRLEHLCGDGEWVSALKQAQEIPLAVLEHIKDAAFKAFFSIQPDGSFQPYCKIKQLPSEPLVTFVERLTRAIGLQVKNEGAQEQVLEEMALTNANEQCKAAILSLPLEPVPTLDDVLQIPLHPDDAPRFTFLVLPSTEKPRGKACAAVGEAVILHYMDDVLMCAPNDDLLSHGLDLTIDSLVAAGFEEEKIRRMPPWMYLGLEIGKQTIVPQKLVVKNNIRTLADVQQLCGSLNWVRPWLGLTTKDLDPLFNLLKGGEELSSPRTLIQEARAALEKVQDCMATRQANRCKSDLPFKFIILGKLPHLHGMIFQWERVEKSKKDKDCRDPLLIIEWVFLSHHRSKRMTRPQELVAELIRKARTRIRELAGCDFECIHIPIEINSGQITKAMLEHLIHENEALQFALDSYTGQAIVERTHQNLKRVLSQQHQALKLETPQIQLSKALFTLNFLNCTFENRNPPIVRHFRENCQLQLKAKPPVMVKDPAARETEGPHDLITWGRGYACVSTPSGPKWVPAKWVKPFIPKTAKPPAEAPQVATAAWRRRKHRTLFF
ncbi:hypothetical protein DUI87_00694 [Hirundo rustica rustica]|uniref:Integrase-type domain-containing protein n=1 Tax=Hirundo rustica rustica TaxID=333673 RepID=A0A3M0LHD7_HIRRU|nr:hypothetical protein DUI87_00694 [Hirundo rustica rustica]